ncbi:gamma-1-syntrophin, partial [Aphelenchoides avenae]
MVLLSDGEGRGRPGRLILTKDQLTVQVPSDLDDASVCGITDAFADASPIRTVNVPKGGSDGKHSVPIIVSKVFPGLPAARTGQLFVGDTIVEVNGVSVDGKTHEEVVEMLKDTSGPHVTLTVRHDSQMAPLLRTGSKKRLSGSAGGSIVDINVFKIQSVLKTPSVDRRQHSVAVAQDEDLNSDAWKTINRLPLPMAIVSRYLWGTDKLRNNAFEVRTVDGKSSGIIHCEDRKALEQWIKHIDTHISGLNKKSIKMSNKYLHPSEHISYIGWVEERMPEGYFDDPKMRWEQRFIIFKGSDVCVFESPPLNSEELDKCVCLYKVYETALKTAIKKKDRREHISILDTYQGNAHLFSLQSAGQLQQFEAAYYNCVYRAITSIQTRTFACSYDGRPAGLVFDIKQGISLYDIPTK